MTSQEGFKRMLRGYIETKTPFAAYWHPTGYGVMLTGPVVSHRRYLEDKDDHQWRTDKTEAVIQARKAAPNAWWNNLARMRRKYWTEVVTVEFNGENIVIDGGMDL